MKNAMVFIKDPDAVLDYHIDWSDWLETGDQITSATFVVPTGLGKELEEHTATRATVWLSGGVVGSVFSVVCHVTTADGREDDRTIEIRIAHL